MDPTSKPDSSISNTKNNSGPETIWTYEKDELDDVSHKAQGQPTVKMDRVNLKAKELMAELDKLEIIKAYEMAKIMGFLVLRIEHINGQTYEIEWFPDDMKKDDPAWPNPNDKFVRLAKELNDLLHKLFLPTMPQCLATIAKKNIQKGPTMSYNRTMINGEYKPKFKYECRCSQTFSPSDSDANFSPMIGTLSRASQG